MTITNYGKYLLLENITQGKKILTDIGLNPNQEKDFKSISDQLLKTPNLIGKFVKFRYVDNIDIESIKRVINWLSNNKHLIGELPNNLLQYDSFEKLDDDIQHISLNNVVKQFYNKLYRSMKTNIDNLNDVNRSSFSELVIEFNKLEPELKTTFFKKLQYFEINKLSFNNFIDALKTYINKNTINDKADSVLTKIKELKDVVKITYYKDNVLVLQTNDKRAIVELGSENWCIVYASNTYYNTYIKDFNSQYIVYNFNLPSSSNYSMFGITVTPNGNTVNGGSQSKFNNYIELNQINELLDIPSNIIVPDPDLMEKKKIYDTVINEISSSKNIINAIKVLRKYDYWGIIPTNKIILLLNISNKDVLKEQLDEEWKNIQNKEFGLFIQYPELCDLVSFDDINKIYGVLTTLYFVIIHQLKVKSDSFADNISVYSVDDYDTFNDMTFRKIEAMYDEIVKEDSKLSMPRYDDLLQSMMNSIAETLANSRQDILTNEKGFNFSDYKNFYDKYVLQEEDLDNDSYPYTFYFENYFDNTFSDFIIEDEFNEFLQKHLRYDFNLDDISNIYEKFNKANYSWKNNKWTPNPISEKLINIFLLKDDEGKYIKDIENDIQLIYVHQNSNRVSDEELFKELHIKSLEINSGTTSGTTVQYFEAGEWTDLDDYYDNEYFKRMDEMDIYDYNSESNEAIEMFDDYADTENIITVANHIHENMDDYDIEEESNFDAIMNALDINDAEQIKSLKSEIKEILDENDDSDLIYPMRWATDDIMNDLYNSELHDKVFGEFTNKFSGKPLDGNRYYKYIDNKLCISIDYSVLVENISYDELNNQYGDRIDVFKLLELYISQNSKLSVNTDIYPYFNNRDKSSIKEYNERLSERLSEL